VPLRTYPYLFAARVAVILSLCLLLVGGSLAKPPTLEPASEFPASVLPGHTYTFHLKYTQLEGDPPSALQMIIDTPYGQVTQKATAPSGDPAAGEDASWVFTPQQSGQYQYHFEVTSSTGGVARYPAGSGELSFESPSMIVKYIVLAVGLIIALFFLPFVVYLIARSANKQSDPGAAARVALLIGILSFCGLAWYLFLQNDETRLIGIAIETIAVGAFLVVMLNRRRTV
jgi:hypothetical protein